MGSSNAKQKKVAEGRFRILNIEEFDVNFKEASELIDEAHQLLKKLKEIDDIRLEFLESKRGYVSTQEVNDRTLKTLHLKIEEICRKLTDINGIVRSYQDLNETRLKSKDYKAIAFNKKVLKKEEQKIADALKKSKVLSNQFSHLDEAIVGHTAQGSIFLK